MSIEITLDQPITVNRSGTETNTTSLTLNIPTARQFVTYGSPFIWKSMDVNDARARPVFNDKTVSKFLADCCQVGEAAIGALSAPDYLSARWALLMAVVTGNDVDSTPGTVKLSSPLTTHAGTVSELKLKTPLAKTVIGLGVPFDWRQDENDNAYVVYNDRLCMKYLSEMTGHDELELDTIAAPDWVKIRNAMFAVMNRAVGTTANPQ